MDPPTEITLQDLPDDVLLKIDMFSRQPGNSAPDLWFHVHSYEHRIRCNRFVTQVVLSNLTLNEVEYQTILSQLKHLSGLSTYARTEADGTRTIQILGLGHHITHTLLRGTTRNSYSIVDDQRVSFAVDEHMHSALAKCLTGTMLTLITPPDSVHIGGHGRPTIRRYDARISGRRVAGTKALQHTCKHYRTLLKRYFFPFSSVEESL